MNKFTILIACLVLGSFGCAKDESEKTTLAPESVSAKNSTTLASDEGVTLKSLPFKFGAAVNVNHMRSKPEYRNLIIKEYSSLTAENAMKIGALHPAKDTYNFTDADYLVDFAIANGKRVHGHTLIWDSSLPSWIKNFQGDYAAWKKLYECHITTIVKHFKGKVASWDVVNEPFNDSGNLQNTIWRQHLGPNYIDMAFIFAHRADPAAKLFINDYGHENGDSRRKGIIAYVKALKAKKVPIDGIGMQFHTRYNRGTSSWTKAINETAATGLLIHISELDIAINPDGIKGFVPTPELLASQSAAYKTVFQLYNAIPKAQQWGITTWNLTDGDSHLKSRPDFALPFDANYQKKPAYQGILDAVK